MSGWAGFSDEELRRMQQRKVAEQKPAHGASSSAQIPRKKQVSSVPRSQEKRSQAAGGEALRTGQQKAEATLRRPGAPEEKEGEKMETESRAEVNQRPATEIEETREEVKKTEEEAEVKELEKQEAERVIRSRLELLQQQQALMEKQNRVKKDLLTRTLHIKQQQTQAEAAILRTVNAELQQLESMATSDIVILRGRIEEADWEYSKARKRYERAEAEFVEAKLDLHRKTEVKEQLVEHLYTIIQQKELRKARKLEELMLRLMLKEAELKEAELKEVELKEVELKEVVEGKGEESMEKEEKTPEDPKEAESMEKEEETPEDPKEVESKKEAETVLPK